MHPLLAQISDAPLPAPSIAWRAIAPELALATAGVVLLMVVAFAPNARRGVLATLTLLGLAVAGALTGWNWDLRAVAFDGAVALDGITRYARVVLLAVGVLTTLMAVSDGARAPAGETREGQAPPEVFPLMLFALTGMVLLAAASDLLVVFIALEILSLALYIMAGSTRRSSAQEAAMKYFLLGAFSSAFLLYGIALCYGAAKSTNLAAIARAVAGTEINASVLLAGVALLAVGFCFKVAAVPFHMWTPDVYQGAPTPVTGFMAAATKVAAFGALLRILYVVLPGLRWDWRPVMWAVAIVTMLGGAIVAITQTDIKRLLAYSSIAHAGFILAGVIATTPDGVSSVLFYLAAYSFVTIGAFAVVTLVRDAGGEATHLSKWAGLGRRSPLVAAVFAVFLLAFAGIPLTSGFAGKFAVFKAAAEGGAAPLVVVGVISSAIAAFFYIRVIVLMFFSEPRPEGPTVAVPSPLTMTAIGVGVAVTLVLGVAPQYFLDLANQAGVFVR
ncbi:MAG TPA: NADH-quinone oxidoreductase subunit NuoN [Actinomycetota bacterium]